MCLSQQAAFWTPLQLAFSSRCSERAGHELNQQWVVALTVSWVSLQSPGSLPAPSISRGSAALDFFLPSCQWVCLHEQNLFCLFRCVVGLFLLSVATPRSEHSPGFVLPHTWGKSFCSQRGAVGLCGCQTFQTTREHPWMDVRITIEG